MRAAPPGRRSAISSTVSSPAFVLATTRAPGIRSPPASASPPGPRLLHRAADDRLRGVHPGRPEEERGEGTVDPRPVAGVLQALGVLLRDHPNLFFDARAPVDGLFEVPPNIEGHIVFEDAASPSAHGRPGTEP